MKRRFTIFIIVLFGVTLIMAYKIEYADFKSAWRSKNTVSTLDDDGINSAVITVCWDFQNNPEIRKANQRLIYKWDLIHFKYVIRNSIQETWSKHAHVSVHDVKLKLKGFSDKDALGGSSVGTRAKNKIIFYLIK